jgi:manganese/iron transport system substrate-binding protein
MVIRFRLACVCLAFLFLQACGAKSTQVGTQEKLKVLATTTIVGDVVKQIGGDLVDLYVLLPPGADPHSFQPTAQDMVQVAEADLIFTNGLGLEGFLDNLLANAGGKVKPVAVSDGVKLLAPGENKTLLESGDEHQGADPHTWFDPQNVAVWVKNIQKTLSEADPKNASVYRANAEAYTNQLFQLDAWIRDQVMLIPLENKKMVTDHVSFTYFAERYGFEQVGAIIPSFSSLAEPSAQDLADLETKIKEMNVPAVFISEAANPTLAQQIAKDTGVNIVRLFNGSLSEPTGLAPTYLDFMRYNVEAIVKALK